MRDLGRAGLLLEIPYRSNCRESSQTVLGRAGRYQQRFRQSRQMTERPLMNEDTTSHPPYAKRPNKTAAAQISPIANEHDSAGTKVATAEEHSAEQYSYPHKTLVVRIQQPGDDSRHEHVVEPRTLSELGMSFLYGGFVHSDSRCWLTLITLHGCWHDVDAVVVACHYLSHNRHEVHVRFDQTIEPSEYSRDALHYRVLLVDDDPCVVRIAKVLLQKLHAHVDHAEDGEVAIEKAMANSYDLILMDVEMPRTDGLSATKELRRRGYSGRIVAVTALTQPEDRDRCIDAGCDTYIPKPYGPESVARALELVFQEPIFSTLTDDRSMTDLIRAFVSEMPPRVRNLEKALIKEDDKTMMSLVRNLKAEGTSYGFEVLTDQAAKIETALIKGASVHNVHKDIEDLLKLCLKVRASTRRMQS